MYYVHATAAEIHAVARHRDLLVEAERERLADRARVGRPGLATVARRIVTRWVPVTRLGRGGAAVPTPAC